MGPVAKPKLSSPAEKRPDKKRFLTLAALLTSTPFLIAIAVHGLLILVGGSVVIFKGGNPLAIFTSQDVGGEAGAEPEAPPSPEESTPEPEPESMPMESEVKPTEAEESNDILVLSAPSTVPSFAPPAPAKMASPSGSAGSGVTMSSSPRPVGRAGARRTGKSTLFGFSEKMGGELEGTMYDLKLKADGKKPSGINDKTFAEAVSKIIANRFRPAVLNEYYRVDKRFYETSFFIPLGNAAEAPEAFGVRSKVKPHNFLIHYTGSFAAPEDGDYRFVGLGDDAIVVLVSGAVRLDATFSPYLSYTERKHKDGPDGFDFFPISKDGKPDESRRDWSKLRQGDWIRMKAKVPMSLDIVLIEQGDPTADNGGAFGFVLCIEKKGVDYPITKKGKVSRPILPLFLLEEPDSNRQRIIRENKDRLEVDLRQAPIFGTAAPTTTSLEPEAEPSSAPPPSPGGRTDNASFPAYGSDWKDGSGSTDGWEGWVLRANGNPEKKSYAGFYLAKQEEKSGSSSVATEGRSFAIFADGEGFQESAAFRGFAKALEPNQSLSLDLVTPLPKSNAGSTGSIGLTLRNGKKSDEPRDYNAASRFELTALEGQPNYQIFDGSQPSDSGLPVSPAGLRVEFTLKTADAYDLKLYPLSGGSPVEFKDRKLGGTPGTPLESLAIFNRDSEQNVFFNRLRLNP